MENDFKVLVLIPARFGSKRFPGKPLAKILDKSMIQMVYDNAQSSGMEICVVTDNSEIEQHVRSFSGNVRMVEDDVHSGSARIYLAYKRYFSNKKYDLIINVQGDEPLLAGDELLRLAKFHMSCKEDICTLVKRKHDFGEEFDDSNRVKAIFSQQTGRCHYFSRSKIPYVSQGEEALYWFLHIGVYSFTPSALERFNRGVDSYYQKVERLEQLGALDMGLTISAIETHKELIGVDIPEDIKIIEGVISGKATGS
ncbi:MAG: 3-deoxy-manno-octulosonate cytidylyltransferase [Bacteriovoracaceae bacterium]|nr:3-deoxy-manno-octulosonate cytidylyltransferase [Bacteriovoracaceae bacterium]